MNKQTAEEFIKSTELVVKFDNTQGCILEEELPNLFIQFAKLHVKAALEAASDNAYVEYIDLHTNEIFDYTDVIFDANVGADVNKKSILNAYPIENIK